MRETEDHSKMPRCPACCQPENALKLIQALVDKQANDEGLWAVNKVVVSKKGSFQYAPLTIMEAGLQDSLRELHALIEEFTV